jgi:hypothetical protein
VSYQGPGDIYPALAWWGLRGYNAAYRGPSIDLTNYALTSTVTINIVAGGSIDMTAFNSAVAAGNNEVTKFYDQTTTGGTDLSNFPGNIGSTRCPLISSAGPGGYPAIHWTFANAGFETNLNGIWAFTQAPPFFYSGTWYLDDNSTTRTTLADGVGGGTAQAGVSIVTHPGEAYTFGGTTISGGPLITLNAWQALTNLFAGANSDTLVQGVSAGLQPTGNQTITVGDTAFMGSASAAAQPWSGYSIEMGVFAGSFTSPSATIAALTTNQRNGGGLWSPF